MKFLLGLLFGFALGVAAGLLMAPQSGEDTRAQLSEQGVMLRDRSSGLSGQVLDRASGLTEQVRNRATDALSQGKELYQRTKNDLTEQYSKARSGEA
jgi:gas vesicle protein